jgi:hypothetical protein
MITNDQWQAFLRYIRSRLATETEFFVAPETLAEACLFKLPFWEDLEERWRREQPNDFDCRGQHPATVTGEPTMIHIWSKP